MTETTKFIEWFAGKLKVVGYPTLEELIDKKERYASFDLIINVSDEFDIGYANQVWDIGHKQYFWFPMGEMHKDMGIVSMFGALQTMHSAYDKSFSILLHCHAGANRSPTVQAAFYFMMTGQHLNDTEMTGKGRLKANNMLLLNCGKHLPELEKMEKWLKACKEAFDNPQSFIGGMYDWTIRQAGCEPDFIKKTNINE